MINVRQDDVRHEIAISLYGEVQKEVIEATLANDFGLAVSFRDTTTICVERPVGTGAAVEILQSEMHPFSATVGLRVEPADPESGVQFRLDVDQRSVPLFIYKTRDRFVEAMTQYISRTLQEGLFGWRVTDCVVTMTECGYYASDGPTKPVSPTLRTTAADFRKLTPLVLMLALERAHTVVCEPIARAEIEIPTDAVGTVLAAVSRLGGVVGTPSLRGTLSVIDGLLPASRVQDLRRQLPGLTGGEGVADATFGGYQPVHGTPATRSAGGSNPGKYDSGHSLLLMGDTGVRRVGDRGRHGRLRRAVRAVGAGRRRLRRRRRRRSPGASPSGASTSCCSPGASTSSTRSRPSIAAETGVEVRTIAVDLAEDGAMATIAAATQDLEVGLLMYCAGADPNYRHFLAEPVESALSMVQRNCARADRAVPPLRRSDGRLGVRAASCWSRRAAGSSAPRTWSPTAPPRRSTWSWPRRCGPSCTSRASTCSGSSSGLTDTPALRRLHGAARRARGLRRPDPGAATPAEEVAADAIANLANGPTWLAGDDVRMGFEHLGAMPRNDAVRLMIEVAGDGDGSDARKEMTQ